MLGAEEQEILEDSFLQAKELKDKNIGEIKEEYELQQNQKFQNEFPIATTLKNIFKVIYLRFL